MAAATHQETQATKPDEGKAGGFGSRGAVNGERHGIARGIGIGRRCNRRIIRVVKGRIVGGEPGLP